MDNLNVFVLDDEEAIHPLLTDYFDDIYHIYSAYSYAGAIKLLESKPYGFFKIFIVDIILQGKKTGLDFAEEYLDPCKTIVLSGFMDKNITDNLVEMGIFAAFDKPIDFGRLFILMNSITRC